MIKKILLIAVLVLSCEQVLASSLKNLTVKQLEEIYQQNEYNNYIPLPSYEVPAIYLETLPKDFGKLNNETYRAHLFIQILSPLALKLNLEISQEREKILQINQAFKKDGNLDSNERQYIEDMAKKYDIFTRLKGLQRDERLLNELVEKVDIIPPSLLIAVAAIETNWGASRIALQGNNLYKQKVWHSQDGITPEGESEDNTYKYQVFPNLFDSIKSYALKLNSDVSFRHTRFMRKETRYREKEPLGTDIAHTMIYHSSLKNFAGILDYTIAYYELNIIDKSKLNSNIYIDKKIKLTKRQKM